LIRNAHTLSIAKEKAMNPDVERQQQKAKEFMSLLPLTLAIAGLPGAEPGKHFTESQLEARATTIRTAYKIARQVIMEVTK
jgi:hypothetical protein